MDPLADSPTKRTLLEAVNSAATTGRYATLALSGLVAYFLVTIASLTHKDLLLNTPLTLPFLDIKIPLYRFFIFAPLFLLVVHCIVLMQHVILRGSIQALNQSLGDHANRKEPLRLELRSYFFVQAYAGPRRPVLMMTLMFLTSWLTLVLLPVLAFLYFQVAFLPLHDAGATWTHRAYLALDLFLLFMMGTLILFPDQKVLERPVYKLLYSPLISLVTHSTLIGALFFSFCIATLPGSRLDRLLGQLGGKITWLPADASHIKTSKDDLKHFSLWSDSKRYPVFGPTAWLLEGEPDPVSGKTKSWFSRNLIVMNTDLVPDDDVREKSGEVSLELRGRNLRHAMLDGTDLHRADLTGAELSHASLVGANLSRTRLQGAKMQHSNLSWANMTGARLDEANLRDAALRQADLSNTHLSRSNMRGAILSWAEMKGADLRRADMRDAILSWANMEEARLFRADLRNTNLYGANLHSADLAVARLDGAIFEAAVLTGVDEGVVDTIRGLRPKSTHELQGLWSGKVKEPDLVGSDSHYDMDLRIDEFGNGFARYPSLGCSGQDAGRKQGDTYIFEERISEGGINCKDGHVKIRAAGDEMSWSWFFVDGRLGAYGTLKKVK